MLKVQRALSHLQYRLQRSYATSSKLIEVTQDDQTGVTTLSMARAPVNSLNKELLRALETSISEAKNNGSKGIVLTSSLPTVFSAGLDLMELYNRTEAQLIEFWTTLQSTWMTLYGLEMPIAAAINGASPAGGCLLGVSCEYRVFVEGKHTIGFNETQLGIVAPKWFRDPYIAIMGYRVAEMALLKGTLFSPNEALKHELVDELATDKQDAIKKCQKYISGFKNISPQARSLTKLALRSDTLTWLKQNRDEDLKVFLNIIQLPQVQAGLKFYLESLKKKA